MSTDNQNSKIDWRVVIELIGLMASVFAILQILIPGGLTPPIAAVIIGLIAVIVLVSLRRWKWQSAVITLTVAGLSLLFVQLLIFSQPATVVGFTISDTGNPVGGMSLVLTNSNGIEQRVVSDQDGRFEVRGVPEGRYSIKANDRLLYTGEVPSGWQRIFNPSVSAGNLPAATSVAIMPTATIFPTETPTNTSSPILTPTSTYTSSPSATHTPRPSATPTATYTSTPIPVFLEHLSVPSNSNLGAKYQVPQTGLYTFEYLSGAYSIWLDSGRVRDCEPECFSNSVMSFLEREGSWGEYALDVSKALFTLGSDQSYVTVQAAESAAKGTKSPNIRLYEGEQITFLVDDRRDGYPDNEGEITLGVFFIPQATNGVAIQIPATTTWVNTDIILQPGQTFVVRADGAARSCNDCPADDYFSQWVSPAGLIDDCGDCIVQGVPEMTLIARVGPIETFVVGTGGRFTVTDGGKLYLGINDSINSFTDNEGYYQATITVLESPENRIVP